MVYLDVPPQLRVFIQKRDVTESSLLGTEYRSHQTVKDLAESFGIPHVEIGRYLVSGVMVDESALVRDACVIQLESSELIPPGVPTFVLDVHLTRLARYLRILGFDCAYRGDYRDEEIAEISEAEQRVVLTRDRGLLKRRRIRYGYWIRSQMPRQQLREVASRYGLRRLEPKQSRCSHCNAPMEPVSRAYAASRVPYYTRRNCKAFYQCSGCGQFYWEGAHAPRIRELRDIFHT